MKNRLMSCFYSLLIFSIMIILSSCGKKTTIDIDPDLETGGSSTAGGGTSGGSTGGGTGSDLTTLWVYLPYESDQIDPNTGEKFDGSFNRPLPSLEVALDKVATLASESVIVDTINIYRGHSDASENVTINTTGLAISGGFYCTESDGAVIDMESDYDDCEDVSDVKQDVIENTGDLYEISRDKLSLVKGTITVSTDITLDQVSVEFDGISGKAAIVINDSSPTIEHAVIDVPDGIKNSDGNSIAIYAEATAATTSPVISGNKITVGSETTSGSNRFYGIWVDSNDSFTGVVSPQIKNNEIEIYDTSTISAGVMIVRDALASEENTSKPVISQNTINMGEIPLSFGVYTTATASQILKNKITVPGSNSTTTFLVSGIAIHNISGGGLTDTSKIYTNLITVNSSQGASAANAVLLQADAEVYANTFVYTKGTDSTLPSAPVVIDNNTHTPQAKIVSNVFMATQLATPKIFADTSTSSDMDDSLSLITYNLFDVNFNDYRDYTETGPTSVVNNNIGESPGLDENNKPTSTSPGLDKGYTFKQMGTLPSSGGPTIPRPGSEPLYGPTTDLDGNSRDHNDAADIGCYEYQGE